MGYLSGVAIKRHPGSSEAQWNLFSGINAPTSQSLLNYILLALVYGGILIHRRQPLTTKWYYYLILGIIDVEANYIEGPKPLKGDLLVILGSMLYAYGNVTEEYLVKKNNRIELMAMLGVFGAVVSGIQMYLPRHQFGSLQGKMFPAYFMLMSVCSAISVAAFAYLHPWKTASTIERYQLGFLMAALGLDLSNLLVFTPMTIEMMMKRHKIEKDLGIGSEVGWSKNAEVAKTSPTLTAMNKKFGMIHGLSSLANIMAFGSLAMHSWYLASKLEL